MPFLCAAVGAETVCVQVLGQHLHAAGVAGRAVVDVVGAALRADAHVQEFAGCAVQLIVVLPFPDDGRLREEGAAGLAVHHERIRFLRRR